MNKQQPEQQFQQQFQIRKRNHSITNVESAKKHKPDNLPKISAQRNIPAFLNKLYSMVEDISTNDLIRWSTDNSSFIVEKHEEFAKTVLPRFYKHNTFASFVRQLNMYNFHKVPHVEQGVLVSDSSLELWEFSHPHFQRARPDLLVLVTRKSSKEKDPIEDDSIEAISLIQQVNRIKKEQSVITNDVKDLHRDNEMLWQKALSTREQYQNHQEAIQKMLQFLSAISTTNNLEHLPKGLIQEASYLTSSTSSQRAHYMEQYEEMQNEEQQQLQHEYLRQQDQHNQDMTQKVQHRSDFSQAINYATKSAQTITEDIDTLQTDIEALANVIGVDPSQIDETMTNQCYDPTFNMPYFPYL